MRLSQQFKEKGSNDVKNPTLSCIWKPTESLGLETLDISFRLLFSKHQLA